MSRLAEIIAHKRQEIAPWLNHTEDWEERARGHRHFRKNHLKKHFRKTLGANFFGLRFKLIQTAFAAVGTRTDRSLK